MFQILMRALQRNFFRIPLITSSNILLWTGIVLALNSLIPAHANADGARNGVMDFQHWQFDSNEPFPLKGEWLFYPQKLVDLNKLTHLSIPSSVAFPQGLLNCSQVLTQSRLPEPIVKTSKENCYGTFVLELRNLPAQPISLFIPELSTAFKLFWNNHLIAYGGVTTDKPELFHAYKGHRIARLLLDHNRGVLILQVANLIDADTALTRNILLGDTAVIENKFAGEEITQALAGALSGIAGVLFLLQYLVRYRYENGLWCLSLFSFSVMLYIFSDGYMVLSWFISDVEWTWALRINLLAQSVLVSCWAIWLQGYYRVEFPIAVSRFLWFYLLVLAPGLLIISESSLIWLETPNMYLNIILVCLIFSYLLRFSWKASNIIWPALASIGLCFAAGLHDILVYYQFILGSDWLPICFVSFIIAQLLILAVTRAKAHRYLEQLNQNLEFEWNKWQKRALLNLNELKTKTDEMDLIHDELKYLQRYDGLTGLLRQDAFQQECQGMVQGLVLSDHPVSMILLDIDRYKQISAQYGYLASDQAMKDVAHLLEQWSDKQRWVARMEGESFALFAMDMDENEALKEAEWLRIRIQQRAIVLGNLSEKNQTFHISVSFGLSSCQADEATFARLIKEADLALNRAKSLGRNCVVSYSDTLQSSLKRSCI